jgi:hypothetical protein
MAPTASGAHGACPACYILDTPLTISQCVAPGTMKNKTKLKIRWTHLFKKQNWEYGLEFYPCKYLSVFSVNIRRAVRNKKQNRYIVQLLHKNIGARGSVVVEALCCNSECRGMAWSGYFLIYLILPAALLPWIRPSLNRNEYQESLKIKKPEGKVRPARRADNLAAIY